MKKEFKIVLIIMAILAIIPAGCATVSGCSAFSNKQWAENAHQVEGVVVKLEEYPASDGTKWSPVIQYYYQGEKRVYTSDIKQSPKPYEVGEKVRILIDPEDSLEVKIDSFSELYFFQTVFGILGAVFLILCLIVIVVVFLLGREKKPSHPSSTIS